MLDTSYLNISNFTECKNFNLGQSYVFFHIITRVFINSEKCAKLQVYCQGNKKALKLYWTIKTHYNIFANSTKLCDSLTNACQKCTLVVGRNLWHHQTGGSAFDDATTPPASTEASEVWVLGVSSHLSACQAHKCHGLCQFGVRLSSRRFLFDILVSNGQLVHPFGNSPLLPPFIIRTI